MTRELVPLFAAQLVVLLLSDSGPGIQHVASRGVRLQVAEEASRRNAMQPLLALPRGFRARARRTGRRAGAKDAQVHAFPARQARPAQARRRARIQGACREGDQRRHQGGDLSCRPARQRHQVHGRAAPRQRRVGRSPRRRHLRASTRLQHLRPAVHVRGPRRWPARARRSLRQGARGGDAQAHRRAACGLRRQRHPALHQFQAADRDAGGHEGAEDARAALAGLHQAGRVARREPDGDRLGASCRLHSHRERSTARRTA